jgi:predicted transcriptional regulator
MIAVVTIPQGGEDMSEAKVSVGTLLSVDEAKRLDDLAALTRDSRAAVIRRAVRELCERELEEPGR